MDYYQYYNQNGGTPNGHNGQNYPGAVPPKKKSGAGKVFLIIMIILAMICAVGTVLFFTAFKGVRSEHHINLGQKYLAEMNYEEAIAEFEKAVKIDPMCVDAYLGLAEAYLEIDDYENAAITLYKGLKATKNKKIKKAYEDLLKEYADEICEVTEDEVIPHEYAEASTGTGPICEVCGHEIIVERINYFDEKGIDYLETTPASIESYYVVYDEGDYSNYAVKSGEQTIEVTVEPYDNDRKQYTIRTELILYEESTRNTVLHTGSIGDFYSGIDFNEKSTKGNTSYSNIQTIPFSGREIDVEYYVNVNWGYAENSGHVCTKTYTVIAPSDYDGLVYCNRKHARWITREEREEDLAKGIGTDVTYLDDLGDHNEYTPATEAGTFVRIRGEFDLEYERLVNEQKQAEKEEKKKERDKDNG